MRGKVTATSTGLALVAGTCAGMAFAQSGGGFEIKGTFSNSIEVADNRDLDPAGGGTATTAETGLSFDLVSETPVSRLSLGTGVNLNYEDTPDEAGSVEPGDPNLRFSYRRQSVTSELDLSARVSTRKVSDFILIDADDDFLADDLVLDTGDLTESRLSARLSTGIDTPLRFDAKITGDIRDYSGTSDPDLYDRQTISGELRSTLMLTQTLDAELFMRASDYEAEDTEQTLRTTLTYGAGLRYQIDPLFSLKGEIAFNDFETTTTSGLGTITVSEQTVSGSLSLTRDLPNGAIVVAYNSDVSPETLRGTLRSDLLIERPDGSVSFGAGISASDTGDTVFVGKAGFRRELPAGELEASASRRALITDDDEEIALTSVNVAYLREVTPTSNWSVDFGLGRTEDIGLGDAAESTRAELTLTYSSEIGENWDWTVGYRGAYADRTSGDATSSAVFTTLDRRFSLRP